MQITKSPERVFNHSIFESLRGWGWVAEVSQGNTVVTASKLDGEATWIADAVIQRGKPLWVHGTFERTIVTQPLAADVSAALDAAIAELAR